MDTEVTNRKGEGKHQISVVGYISHSQLWNDGREGQAVCFDPKRRPAAWCSLGALRRPRWRAIVPFPALCSDWRFI